jgi:hypothetical protein
VEFRTDSSEKVFPMVPAGASNDDVLTAPGMTPGLELRRQANGR